MAVGLEDTVAAPPSPANPAHPSSAKPSQPPAASNDAGPDRRTAAASNEVGPDRPTASSSSAAPDLTLSERRDAPVPTNTPRLGAGKQLGHFRIERLLGAGGMGEVYLATDLALDRPVAIKVLPEEMAARADRRERLVREARAQARVSHPHVAHIYFVGEDNGQLYFAMEYISGTTVADRIAKGPLPVDDAIAIIRAAITGLREAEKHGVTHRDVKPSNLMIDANGIVKLVDFGLAAQREPTDDDTCGGVAQTSVAGTPLYMAPEQAFGERVDFRADIYALGATLYHLVSGKPPFEAENADALRTKHATAVRPPVVRHSGQTRSVVTGIERLCARMMAPEPADRFASYDELLRELELTSSEHTRPAGASVRFMAALVDMLVTLVFIGVGAIAAEALGYGPDFNINPAIITIFGGFTFFLLARYGRTAGQALFELEVADVATGSLPRKRQAAIRVLIPLSFPIIDMVLAWAGNMFSMPALVTAGDIVGFGFFLVPIAVIWASVRTPAKRTVWDRASSTIVRYRMPRAKLDQSA